MRQRLRPARMRSMARRPEGPRRFSLSPRGRRIAGWLAAIAIIAVIALVVRFLGGNADGASVVPPGSESPTPSLRTAATIRFGTALDASTHEVAVAAETTRFIESDLFAYSFRPAAPPPTTVWVEVRREPDGSGEAVQEPSPQQLADDALVVAFEVPAAALFRDFGGGSFQMRIYLEEGGAPAAVGSFELVGTAPSPSG